MKTKLPAAPPPFCFLAQTPRCALVEAKSSTIAADCFKCGYLTELQSQSQAQVACDLRLTIYPLWLLFLQKWKQKIVIESRDSSFLFFIALAFLHKISSSLIVYIYPCICVQLYIEIYVYLYAIWLIALIGWKCLESVTVVESTLINAIPPVKSISMAFTYTCSYITYITRIYRHRQQSASKTTTKLRPCVSLWDIPRLDQATKLELKIIHHKQLPTKMRQSKLRQRLTLAASEEKSNQLKKKRIKYKYIYLYM